MDERPFLMDAREYLTLLHKRRVLVLTCLGVAFLLATLYNYVARPLYQATAVVLIDRHAPNVLPGREVQETSTGSDYYETQYALLRGRSLAERAVERLDLTRSREFQQGPLLSPWERVRSLLGKAPDAGGDGAALPVSPAVAAFRSRLEVEPVPGSRLVSLRFTAYEPDLAARAANTVAQLFIEQSLEFQYTASAEATAWLKQRVREQQARVEEAERALQQYREREGLLNVEERQGLVDQKVVALAAAVVAARTERLAREAQVRQLRGLPPDELAVSPAVLQSEGVQALRARLSGLKDEEARLSETLGARHPEMLGLRSRIAAAEEKLRLEAQGVVRAAEAALATARAQEASLAQDLEAAKREALVTSRKAIEHGALRRQVEAHQQVLRELLGRTQESGLETELTTTNIRVVEKAEVPRRPAYPRRLRNYQLALIAGLAAGIALALLFEHLDNTVKTPEDVKNRLRLPFLGMVPASAAAVPGEAEPAPAVVREPQSAVAEAYRVVRTNLIFSSAEATSRVLVVSSANPGEGKTTTVANLAASLADNGARVLAVEADLRRPTMQRHFGTEKTPGLTDLIVGKCTVSHATQWTRVSGVQLVPAGYIPPNPAELLGSQSLREVIQAFRKRYDWVVIDAPPILGMADTPVLCPLTDGVVLVVWAEHCSRPAVEQAVDQVVRVGGKVTGVVLNKVDLARNAYYYSHYYGDYYKGYADAAEPRAAVVEPLRRG
jgi:capsular exopolysaccharide synthesis family protein